MKRILCVCLLATLVLGAAGCNGNSSESVTTTEKQVESSSVQESSVVESSLDEKSEESNSSSSEIKDTSVEKTSEPEPSETEEKISSEETTVDSESEESTVDSAQEIYFSIATSETTNAFDDILIPIVENKGIKVSREDDTLSFTASESICREIANEYKDYYNNQPENDKSTIKLVKISDNFDTVEFFVTKEFEKSADSLGVLLFSHPMTVLQLLTGKSFDQVHYTNRVINIDTNEIITEGIMPDDLKVSDTTKE